MPIADMLSGGRRGRLWRRWAFGAASVAVHAALLAALVVATEEGPAPAVAEGEEEVTYVDISAFPPPPPPAATPEPQPAEPQPTQPRPEPRPQPPRPETPPRATDIVEPEPDSIEEPLGTVPPPTPVRAPVREGPPAGAVTTTGAGGQAGGVEGGVEGGRVGGQVGAEPVEGGTFVAGVVDRRAELSNRGDLARILERLYPPRLRDRGVGGRVVVQFVVGTNGRVDMSTVQVMSADHDELVEATIEAMREFRFTPARMGDRTVRMLTQMPIVWQVERL